MFSNRGVGCDVVLWETPEVIIHDAANCDMFDEVGDDIVMLMTTE